MILKNRAILQMYVDYDEYIRWIIESCEHLEYTDGIYEDDISCFTNDICLYLDLDNLYDNEPTH